MNTSAFFQTLIKKINFLLLFKNVQEIAFSLQSKIWFPTHWTLSVGLRISNHISSFKTADIRKIQFANGKATIKNWKRWLYSKRKSLNFYRSLLDPLFWGIPYTILRFDYFWSRDHRWKYRGCERNERFWTNKNSVFKQ